MKNSVPWIMLWGCALLAAGPVRAQYAAPGFPMLPQGRLPVVVVPAKLQSPVLPRFWHEADPAKLAAGRSQFFEFVSEHAKFPDGARPTARPPGRARCPLAASTCACWSGPMARCASRPT